MNEQEKRQVMESLISEIQIYPERQENGQWLKSIKFRLPIIEYDVKVSSLYIAKVKEKYGIMGSKDKQYPQPSNKNRE